jgi:hypothetical protein
MDPEVTFPQNWTAPRELKSALPRQTRFSGRGMFNIILSVVFLFAALFLGLWLKNEASKDTAHTRQLHAQGQEASGEINKLWESKSARMVAYEFTANGARIHGESEVPDKMWAGVRRAGFLPVRYLPSDPTVNHPAAWDAERLPEWFPVVIPLLWVLGSGFLLFNLRRQGKVATDGVPAAGVVTKCRRVKGGWAARYQFRTPEGAIAKGRDRVYSKLEPGSSVCVLYLPDNPRRNHIYPLCLYTVNQ